jgi:3-oxoacyl-[acyl-carrier protein] reductase
MTAPISGQIDLTEKVAIVTGGSRGIGQATCIALAREGVHVAVCDVLPSEEMVKKISSKERETLDIRCDISKKASVQKAVSQVIHAWGRVDILVNNAGVLGDSSRQFEEYSEEDWDQLLQTNLRGTFFMTQAVWPYLTKQGGGKIICLGSIAGRIGGLLAGPHYCASKGGIHAFVKWAAKKGASLGIYVNGIAPGPILTPMTTNEPYKDDMVPLGRLGQPEDIAEVVVFLASQASNFITGNIIDVNGGILMV